MRSVYVLNKTNYDRSGIVVCGFPFDKGEVTSLNQVITVSQANGLGTNPTFTQKVQWEPYGVNYEDGSYRYGKIAFRADVAANSERRAIVNPAGGSYTSVPYDPAVYNMFTGVKFYFRMNGQEVDLDFSQLTLISTGDSDCHYKRYRYFARPFETMHWIWVEVVFDIPSLSIYNLNQNAISDTPIEHINFWFRYGSSHLERNKGQQYGTYAREQRRHFLTDYVFLTIMGCDSLFRFEEHTYGKLNLNNLPASFPANFPSTNGYIYALEDPNYNNRANNTHAIKYSNSRNFRGCLIVGNNQRSSILAEREGELTAIADGWNKYVPPVFSEIPLPPNITAGDRADQCARIDRMMFNQTDGAQNLARVMPKPFPAGGYGIKPYCPGAGDQGIFGNAFQANPLYYTMSAAYSRELPYIIHSTELWGCRPLWMYEEDGTVFNPDNYPLVNIWWGEIHWTSRDFCGAWYPPWRVEVVGGENVIVDIEAPSPLSSYPYEEWAGTDRQHCSSHQEALAAIITADYFMLDCFAKTWAENFAAAAPVNETDNYTINSWEADRAGARMLQTLVTLYYATGSDRALRAIARKYWQGYAIKISWEYGNPGGIEKLKFVDVWGSWSDGLRNWYNYIPDQGRYRVDQYPDRLPEGPGNLFIFEEHANPWYHPWQQSFVVATYIAIERMFDDLYPYGAYMLGSNITKLTGPGQSIAPGSIPIFGYIAGDLARDLAATVVMHNTHYFGPGSEWNWHNIALQVTPRDPGGPNQLLAHTRERMIECFPVGATVVGTISGTTGTISLLLGGAFGGEFVGSNPFRNVYVKLFLKNVTGPGFTSTDNYTLQEPINVYLNGNLIYSTTQYAGPGQSSGFMNNGWFGMNSCCIDKFGLGRESANYRKALTNTDFEETDPRCLWNVYTQEGPKWGQFDRDYIKWQATCVPVVLDGLKRNYYTTNDPNYSLARLNSKALSISNYMLGMASVDVGEWDRRSWPYMALYPDFTNSGNVIKTVGVLDGNAVTNEPTIETNNIRSVTVGKITSSQEEVKLLIESISIILPFTVYSVTPTNVTISPKAVGDTLYKQAVQIPIVKFDWNLSLASSVESTSEAPSAFTATTSNSRVTKVNAIINLSIDGPNQSTSGIIGEFENPNSEYPTLEINEPETIIKDADTAEYPLVINPTVP
jgi:hypothetical protein